MIGLECLEFIFAKDWERAFLILANKRSDVDEYLEELSNLLGIIRSENVLPQRTQNMLDYLEKYNSEDL